MCCIFRHLSALFQEVVTRSQYFPARPTKFVGNVERTQRKIFLLQILHFPKMGEIMVHARHWKRYCTSVHCDIIRFAKKILIKFREAFKEAEGTTYEAPALRQLFWYTDFTAQYLNIGYFTFWERITREQFNHFSPNFQGICISLYIWAWIEDLIIFHLQHQILLKNSIKTACYLYARLGKPEIPKFLLY